MSRAITGFFLGCVATALIVWLVVLPHVRQTYRTVGHNDGVISAQAEIAEKIPAALGSDLTATEEQQLLFSVKATSVVIVERNGVKTLRATP